jgi:zinc/manganese transport system permease protein
MLVGNIITVSPAEVAQVAALYGAVGLLHWLCRRPFFRISTDPDAAFREGWRVRRWDFIFYASFGLVVTSSVRIAGVLLVFAYLIVPALAGTALGGSIGRRLLIGWGFGTLVSVAGIAASAILDLPTGATVVCAFGIALLLGWALMRAARLSRPGSAAVARAARPTCPARGEDAGP